MIGHLTDSEWVYGYRLRLILCEDAPTILGTEQDLWVAALRHNEREPSELVGIFRTLRQFNLAVWQRTPPEDLQRTGQQNERGPESLGMMLRLLAGHDLIEAVHATGVAPSVHRLSIDAGSLDGLMHRPLIDALRHNSSTGVDVKAILTQNYCCQALLSNRLLTKTPSHVCDPGETDENLRNSTGLRHANSGNGRNSSFGGRLGMNNHARKQDEDTGELDHNIEILLPTKEIYKAKNTFCERKHRARCGPQSEAS